MSTVTGERGLNVDGVTVRFGDHVAVDDVSLRAAPGQVVALVGPSGCGKSTLLRVIAGLEVPDEGGVRWDGEAVGSMAPHRRGFGLMFQDHALFPHRRVAENVAFGLRMASMALPKREKRVHEMLALVGLEGYGERGVDTLSGGEAQRVALARALAPSPRLLMLDEPLGSLDRSLRERLAEDVRDILTRLGLAAIHVTHDQDEAYAVADHLVVMGEGRVRRRGPVAEVWHDPGTASTARFLGHDNVLDAASAAALDLGDGSRAVMVPESALDFVAVSTAALPGGWPAVVADVRFRGPTSRVRLSVEGRGGAVSLAIHTADPPELGVVGSVAVTRRRVITLAPDDRNVDG